MFCGLLIIFWINLSVTSQEFRTDTWNDLFISIVFLFGWQLLVVMKLLFLPITAIPIVIVSLLTNFWLHWFGLECILIVLFLSEHSWVSAHWPWVGFLYWIRTLFSLYPIFSNSYWLSVNYTFGSWILSTHRAGASIRAVTIFSYSSLVVCAFHVSWRIRNLLLTVIVHWFLISYNVTYWPSTEPSIKRCTCVNKQKNDEAGASGRGCRNITLTCGRGWIRCRRIRPEEAGVCQTII